MDVTTVPGSAPRGRVGRRRRALALGVVWLCALGHATSTLLPFASLPGWADTWGTLAVNAAACAILAVQARVVRVERRSWTWLAVALAVYLVGDLLWALLGQPDGVSIADAFWIAFYPLLYVGLLSLVRTRTGTRGLAPWLDGIVLGLAVSALLGALVLDPIIRSATALSSVAVVVNLAYPTGDLLLIVLLVAALGPLRGKPDRALLLVALSTALFAVGDGSYLVLSAKGTYHPGSPVDSAWVLAYALLASASWVRTPARERAAAVVIERGNAMPLAGASVAVGVLCLDHWNDVSVGAVFLAAAALAAVIARMLLAQRDLRGMAVIHREARTDDLTQLSNRRSFGERLVESTSTDPRSAVLLLDLDGFKDVNDSLGHHAGDQLLTVVARRLLAIAQGQAVVARLGGDEFALLVRRRTPVEVIDVARQIHEALVEPIPVESLRIRIDASIGIALFPEHGATPSDLMRCADVAMYTAKRARCGTVVYDVESDPNNRQQLELLNELHAAIDQDQLVLHYQPKVNLADGALRGFEALVRWNHPTRALLYPADFIPLIARARLMPRLTQLVLRKAMSEMRNAQPTLARLSPDWSVSVNIAPDDLLDDRFPEMVARLLAEVGFAAKRLVLEITEGALISEPVRAERAIARLRSIGVRISLDDFGVGFSSLGHLSSLTVDELKLDRSLIADLLDEDRARAIVRATAGLAGALNLELVVEGVEDEETRLCLMNLDCTIAQGFYFARPMPVGDIAAWLANSSPPTEVRVAG